MLKCKIFSGNFSASSVSADVIMNKFLLENPNITIKEFRYQQAHHGDHSICILYDTRYAELIKKIEEEK